MNKLFSVSNRSRWFLPTLTAFFLALAAILFTVQGIARQKPNSAGNGHSFLSIGGFFASNNVVIADSPRPAPEQPPSGVGAARDEQTSKAIHKLLDDQQQAWNKGDLKGFMEGYWNSPELSFYSGNTKTKGWQQTFDRYRKRYQEEGREMGHLTFSEVVLDGTGPDTVIVRGRWKLEKKAETHDGLYTLIVRKLPEGWRIVHDHTSAADPVPAKKPGNE
ncbi:MAG TPA: nuclear transport factor 2 family protein [Gemmataceae bacterium]|jgi:beta-aspartyl-peptidase (threonine type)|nr:nuclear transport factor 2 family protein [Gemmataceae bacterium]